MTTTGGMSKAKRSSFVPKYVELAQRLLRYIADEKLKQGDLLGTEEGISKEFKVSRVTVRHALAMLEEDGTISRRRAQGTFVKNAVDHRHFRAIRGIVVVVCSNSQAINTDEDFAFATILRNIESTLTTNGFSVQVLGIGEDKETDQTRLRNIAESHDVVGVCTIGDCIRPHIGLFKNVPFLESSSYYPADLPWVGNDAKIACSESIKHLLSHGHRSIGLLCGPWVDQEGFAMLAEGYRAAFADVDADFHRCMLYYAYPGESLDDVARSLLGSPITPTAVFAENWKVCKAIINAATKLGLHIPNELSLIGFGQNVLQIDAPVEVTAYVPDSAGVGRKVAEVLTEMILKKSAPNEPVRVPGALIERASVRRYTKT